MKKIFLSLVLLLNAVKSFCAIAVITPGQAGDMPTSERYLIMGSITVVLVFVLLYFRKQNRKKEGLK
jgi:FtsH-binding integral membrane protein